MYGGFTENASAAGIKLHCVKVLHGGRTVLRQCFDDDIAYPVYSATKAVTACAAMIAHSEGRLDISDKLYKYLDSRYSDIIPEGFKELAFTDFMTMSAAHYPFRPFETEGLVDEPDDNDWLKNILRMKVDHSDRSFNYSNIPAYLVGAACENAVGLPLDEYLYTRLFEPLGWGRPVFEKSPEGHFYGATGLELTIDRFADFGQFFMQKGMWNGRQLIPRELMEKAVSPIVSTGSERYGYFVWVCKNCFALSGKWGNRCVVCPDKGLVLAYLSHQPERSGELARLAFDFMRNFGK